MFVLYFSEAKYENLFYILLGLFLTFIGYIRKETKLIMYGSLLTLSIFLFIHNGSSLINEKNNVDLFYFVLSLLLFYVSYMNNKLNDKIYDVLFITGVLTITYNIVEFIKKSEKYQ